MTTAYLSPPQLGLQYSHRSSTYLPHDSPSSPTSDEFVLDSPIDPVGVIGQRPLRPGTEGSEFFSAVYLDSPYESIRAVSPGLIGSTAPLRIKKRVKEKKPELSSPRQPRRHSTLSLPQSPRLTRSLSLTSLTTLALQPTSLSHQPSTSSQSSLHPHHSISNLFLTSQSSPLIMSPIPPFPPPGHLPTPPAHLPTRTTRSPSGQSELHLGLGRFGVYDESAKPGPSPTVSPTTSPIRRQFQTIHITPETPTPPRTKPTRRIIPSSPITPSRAPSKAAKLLGAGIPTHPTTNKSAKKSDHFRPLPTQTLVEIEKFFGSSNTNAKRVAVEKVGEGGTVRYKGGDGRMWSDLEEEQEFAWLMAEIGSGAGGGVGGTGGIGTSGRASVEERSGEVVEDRRWGMDDFTSVLSLPKTSKNTDTSLPTKPQPLQTRTQTAPTALALQPWSTPKPTTNVKGEYQPLLTPPKSLLIPPQRSTSHSNAHVHSQSESFIPHILTSKNGTDSPPRPKHRPPPLTLASPPKNPKLPMISTTPPVINPNTPFTRPRDAPNPFISDSLPAVPRIEGRLLPAVEVASFMDMGEVRGLGMGMGGGGGMGMGTGVGVGVGREREREMEVERDISFFEPITPVEEKPLHRRIGSEGGGAKGGGRRVVKRLGEGGLRESLRRVV